MRLVCPKCAAQYEVADTAIPEAGRDVQCSNCGHGWFQNRPSAPPQVTEVAPVAALDAAPPFPPPPPFAQPSRAEPPAAPLPPGLQRKPLDEQVMAILREEAVREAVARRADAMPVSGPEPVPASAPVPAPTPVTPPAPSSAALPPFVSEQPQPLSPPQPVPAQAVARRGLLPDIEEINSTLTAGNQRHSDPTHPQEDGRAGFRAGFGVMMALVALAAAAYVLAPRIITLLPQGTGAMTAYVDTVDDLRRKLDATVTSVQTYVETLLLPSE